MNMNSVTGGKIVCVVGFCKRSGCLTGPGKCPCSIVEGTAGEEEEGSVREGEESVGGACKYLLLSS